MSLNLWRRFTDPNTGHACYYNAITHETRWTLPDDLEPPEEDGNYALSSALQQLQLVSDFTSSEAQSDQVIGYRAYQTQNIARYGASSQVLKSQETGSQPNYYARQAAPQPGSSAGALMQSLQRTQRHLQGGYSPGLTEPLDPEYKIRDKPAKFFKEGKVFMMLWSEPTAATRVGSEVTLGIHGQNIHSRIRRFIVIRTSHGSSACLQILTYGGQGVARHGVEKSDHAIIYTGSHPPDPTKAEGPSYIGEAEMHPVSIRVTPHMPGEKLDPMSRINLGKIYTVEHNLKVRAFGVVDNLEQLKRMHRFVWNREPQPQGRRPRFQDDSALSRKAFSSSQTIVATSRKMAGSDDALSSSDESRRKGSLKK